MSIDTQPRRAWQPLGDVDPADLADTRLELHWAVQVVGAVPSAFREPEPDHSHSSLVWAAPRATLLTQPVGRDGAVLAGLDFLPFALVVLDREGNSLERTDLEGRTLHDAYGWMAGRLAAHGVGTGDADALPRPDDSFPPHPLRTAAAFTGGVRSARAELARWYGNAQLVLTKLVEGQAGASSVRCWPHHFDLAALITLEDTGAPDTSRSVGLGMTPGDEHYAEPYLYVTPWPYPRDPELPPLGGAGRWHTEGWIGAVLSGTALLEAGSDAKSQAECARQFFASAVPAAAALARTAPE